MGWPWFLPSASSITASAQPALVVIIPGGVLLTEGSITAGTGADQRVMTV